MQDIIKELSIISGYSFYDSRIGLQALTHSSYAQSHGLQKNDNERLEFLGDAVLELAVSRYLFNGYPKMREGEMTRSRSWLVREDSLYKAALRIGLDKLIRLDESEEKIGGRNKPSILSDAYEAIIAAIYTDGGYAPAEDFIFRTLLKDLKEEDILPRKDAKTLLQEFIQSSDSKSCITYHLIDTSGPDHKKVFRMSVSINDVLMGEGTGFSKRSAEEEAASEALSKLLSRQE